MITIVMITRQPAFTSPYCTHTDTWLPPARRVCHSAAPAVACGASSLRPAVKLIDPPDDEPQALMARPAGQRCTLELGAIGVGAPSA
ncbi:hypothetical protein CONPUDRAFT_150714 [Coniophora puteana RWD-64-598 SS2]|uniref:Uncharacterized protein n=1 Tax=Coniophora puteana (strain RWD-64-598) TaxID=741705 RepID=A0A5M3MWX4_CONPW|nr:uncharacterized protein CONPUDRAFT_150714 [Coniophora puteana RWD-64-598 SS2]EIW83643.1 hypothetical protein CONPUDRAFT_150714 [Coniophora puteana RWD-64-598 SS2]